MSYLVCDVRFKSSNKWNFELDVPYFYFEINAERQAYVVDYDFCCMKSIERIKLYDLEADKYMECGTDGVIALMLKRKILGGDYGKRDGFKFIKIPLIPYEAYLLTTMISYKQDKLHLSGISIHLPVRAEFNIKVIPLNCTSSFDFIDKIDLYSYSELDTRIYLGTYLWYCYRFVNEGAYYSLVEEDLEGQKIIVKLFAKYKFYVQAYMEITYTIDKIAEWKRLRTKIKLTRR